MSSNKFQRDSENKVLGGVCSGLANYFNLDVALLRVVFVISFLFASFGFWLYIILWIVIPIDSQQKIDVGKGCGQQSTDDIQQTATNNKNSKVTTVFAGLFVILIGIIFLINNYVPIYWVWDLWPIVLVGLGVMMIYNASKKGDNNE